MNEKNCGMWVGVKPECSRGDMLDHMSSAGVGGTVSESLLTVLSLRDPFG